MGMNRRHLFVLSMFLFTAAACQTAVPLTDPIEETPEPTLTHPPVPVNTAVSTIPPTDTPSPTPLPRDVEAALQLIADGFVSPVALAAPDDGTGHLFVLDQIGVVCVLDAAGNRLPEPLLDLRSNMVELNQSYDERGLLGVALHPNFAENGRFYLYYFFWRRCGT